MTETVAEETASGILPLLPLKNVVLLPKTIIPVIVGRALSIKAVEYALSHNRTLFVTTQKELDIETPTPSDVFKYGTRATILQVMRMPNGALKILAEGIHRAYITDFVSTEDFFAVAVHDMLTLNNEPSIELEALWRQLQFLYKTYASLNDKAPADLIKPTTKFPEDIEIMADAVAINIADISVSDRQRVLESADLHERIMIIAQLLKKEIDILQTEQRIQGLIQTQVEKNQREYYLTEQMKAIQKELGREDLSSELDQLRAKAQSLELSKEALEKVEKELRRLEQMPPLSSEAVVSRNYIDWILSLPWNKMSKDTISLVQAEKILDKSHTGLKKVKERIIEFLAAKKFSQNLERSPIICLIGPPGVGKTSLARSIAESLGREFVRISLGGVRDEAEIRGHRRTYIGALPGKIIQAMKKARTTNPVILLDEIDKISRDIHGDPSAALLEVLDPEQNKTFVDHFLDIEYDLSKIIFIATANLEESIPYPLYDRLEIIKLSGYTEEEKLAIAKQFLMPNGLKEYGLTKRQFKLPEDIIKIIINLYTKEAGVRQLERVITKLMRKTIQELLNNSQIMGVTVTQELLKKWLGHPPFKKTSLSSAQKRIGLATGLAWTEIGGDVLEIEAAILPGKGGITLTGQLGDIMQESAHAALSYIRSRAKDLGLKTSFYTSKDVHLHIPEGATPKDGPSAGIAIATALVSALTEQPTKSHLAMTGEVTLQGRILAIGGLKEKLLAAKQHSITLVLIPQENYDDTQDILKDTDLSGLEIIYVKNMDEVLAHAFEKNPLIRKKNQKKEKKAVNNHFEETAKKRAKKTKK